MCCRLYGVGAAVGGPLGGWINDRYSWWVHHFRQARRSPNPELNQIFIVGAWLSTSRYVNSWISNRREATPLNEMQRSRSSCLPSLLWPRGSTSSCLKKCEARVYQKSWGGSTSLALSPSPALLDVCCSVLAWRPQTRYHGVAQSSSDSSQAVPYLLLLSFW